MLFLSLHICLYHSVLLLVSQFLFLSKYITMSTRFPSELLILLILFSYRWPPDVLLFRETCTAARNRKESAKIEYTSQIPKCMAWRETPVTTVSSHADFQLPQAFFCYFVTVRPAVSNSHVIPLTGEGDRSETPCFVLDFFKLNYMELGK